VIPVSSAFLAAVSGSHQIAVRARVVAAGQSGTNPTGEEIPVLSGTVELDATADIRGTLTLTTEGRWPTASDPLLLPYGNEVFVERGVYVGGEVEWCPLGYYRINGPDQDDAPDGPIVLECSDRMATIRDSRLTSPRALPSSMTYGAAVEDLILDVYPSAVIEWDDATVNQPLGRTVMLEQDRLRGLQDLVAGVGKLMWWDHRGVLVIKDPPSISTPVAAIRHGDGGVLVNLSRQLSREGAYNAVVAEGESASTDNPVRVVRINNDPNSPTYWFGSFGKIPRFYSSPLITNATQARKAADTLLLKSLGLPYTVDFQMVPNPALEPWDPVTITYSDAPAETHVLQRVTIPLTAVEGMTADTREQTTVVIGEL